MGTVTGVTVAGTGVSGVVVGLTGVGVGGNIRGVAVGVGDGMPGRIGVGVASIGVGTVGKVIAVGVGGNVIAVGVGGKTMAVGVGDVEVQAIATINPAEKTARVSRVRSRATRFSSIITSPGLALPIR